MLRAASALVSQPRQLAAASAGSVHGCEHRTILVPGRSSHRSTNATSSAGAPRNGPSPGSTVSADAASASTTGIGGTPRRATPADASLP